MKNKKLFKTLIILIIIGLVAFITLKIINNRSALIDEMEMRTIAWESMNKAQQNLVIDDYEFFHQKTDSEREKFKSIKTNGWKKAKLETAKFKDVEIFEEHSGLLDKIWLWYIFDKNIVKVTFITQSDGVMGPYVIYIDPLTKAIVGYNVME